MLCSRCHRPFSDRGAPRVVPCAGTSAAGRTRWRGSVDASAERRDRRGLRSIMRRAARTALVSSTATAPSDLSPSIAKTENGGAEDRPPTRARHPSTSGRPLRRDAPCRSRPEPRCCVGRRRPAPIRCGHGRAAPSCWAASQCSTRGSGTPASSRCRATSPTAKYAPGREVTLTVVDQRPPRSTSQPGPAGQLVAGTMPTPSSTASKTGVGRRRVRHDPRRDAATSLATPGVAQVVAALQCGVVHPAGHRGAQRRGQRRIDRIHHGHLTSRARRRWRRPRHRSARPRRRARGSRVQRVPRAARRPRHVRSTCTRAIGDTRRRAAGRPPPVARRRRQRARRPADCSTVRARCRRPQHCRLGHQLDPLLVVPLRGLERDGLVVLLTGEVVLGQRGPVVGELARIDQMSGRPRSRPPAGARRC